MPDIYLIFYSFLIDRLTVLGTKYEIGAVIHTDFDDSLPFFGIIKKMYVLSSSIKRVYFKIDLLHTEEFCSDYRTYIVKKLIHPPSSCDTLKIIAVLFTTQFCKAVSCE